MTDTRASRFQITEGNKDGGLFNDQQLKVLSKKIMDIYDVDNSGNIGIYEIGNMMSDVYRSFNFSFNPSGSDRAAFMRIMTRKALN